MKCPTIILTRNAYAWQFGGAEQFTINLAEELAAAGYRPVVITRVPELIAKCRAQGITAKRNLWLRNKTQRRWAPVYYLLWPALVGQYVWWLWRYRAKLLIAGSRDDQIFGTRAARLLHRPAMWVDHADMKGILAGAMPYARTSYYRALSYVSKIVAVSQAERAKIAAHLPAQYHGKVTVINNGARKPEGTPLTKPQGLLVSYIGRIEREKGVLDLAAAVPAVLKLHPDVHFWLAGKGQDFTRVENELVAKYPQNVRLLGHLDQVGALLKISDLFVYPSHHDASPLAPVEALVCGVPVVATQVGGIPEVITPECGRLVTPNDPKALAAALNELLGNAKLRKQLSQAALAAGRELEFGNVVKRSYLPLIKELVE